MDKEEILTGVLIEDSVTFSYIEVCQRFHIPKELLAQMLEEGLFASPSTELEQVHIDPTALRRIETAYRLHRDLDINLPGVALALELLEEMEKMHRELDVLRKHF